MYAFTRTDIDRNAIRRRIAKMPDEALIVYGLSAAFMAERSSRETYKVQLEEARAEWRKRHPAQQNSI